jgi:predicted regulator of Ras-like GTPase activity (Roadblock/LC7/MglB family)
MGSGLTLSSELGEKVSRILAELRQKTDATCVLLADTSGQLVSKDGSMGADATIFAALAAGDMAATAELARMLKESRPFKMHLHEGENFNIYLCTVEGSFLLVVIFRTTVQIGLVRIFSARAAEALLPLVSQFESMQGPANHGVDADFSSSLSSVLDEALREA